MTTDTVATVKALLDEGREVVPVKRGSKVPLVKWRTWQRPTDEDIERFWGGDEPADVGIRLRPTEAVIDLDDPQLVAALKLPLSQLTCSSRTPSGGFHAYFTVRNPSKTLHPRLGVDILGVGSIVVIPPSVGREYANGTREWQTVDDATVLISGLLAELGLEIRPTDSAGYLQTLDSIEPGERNVSLTRLAGILRKAGFAGNSLLSALTGLNNGLCETPLPDDEIQHIAEQISTKHPDPFDTDAYIVSEISPTDPVPTLEMWVDGVLPKEGITMIYGLPGQGKTYLAVYLMLCMEYGLPFLGKATQQGRVVYVDWERRGLMFRRRAHAIAAGMGIRPQTRLTYIEAKASLASIMDAITNQIFLLQPNVVIIDSLTIAMMGLDPKDAKDVIPQLNRLNNLNATVVVLDHQRKPQFGESAAGISPFGSIFKQAIASNVWQVYKTYRQYEEEQMSFTMRYEKGNFEDLGSQELHAVVKFAFDGNRQLASASFETTEGPSPAGAILQVMRDKGRESGWQLRHIIAHTGMSESTARRWLEKLEKDGRIIREGDGQGKAATWFLVEDTE